MKHLPLLPLLLLPVWTWAGPPEDLHQTYTHLLETHVSEGKVDYQALRESPEALKTYLQKLADITREEYGTWNEKDQLAFLLNLYNAATLKLIVDENPEDSIKDIGSWLKGPWDQRVVELWGKTRTLNELEHEIIRVDFLETPETHFALVCAAKGCPPLRSEAYTGENLEEQLRDQMNTFLGNETKNRKNAERETLYLSPIFKWYKEDFEKKSGSVQEYLAETWPEVKAGWRIRYTNYDWSLNHAE